MYGAIEAGGTKFVCAVACEPDKILAKTSFATGLPKETIARVEEFFRAQSRAFGKLRAVGMGSFGPLHVNAKSTKYGRIGATPKAGWSGFDVAGAVEKATGAKVVFDTDVHCALIGEAVYGAGVGLKDVIYLTVGTGIGGGAIINKKIVYGTSHPEFGHMLVPKHIDDKDFAGNCPFHGDSCVEGLASGPAIAKRWQADPATLAMDHNAWQLQGHYIAVLCMNLFLSFAPQRIILGGGVMKQVQLFPIIHKEIKLLMANYIDFDRVAQDVEDLIVPASLQGDAGIYGGIYMAKSAL